MISTLSSATMDLGSCVATGDDALAQHDTICSIINISIHLVYVVMAETMLLLPWDTSF